MSSAEDVVPQTAVGAEMPAETAALPQLNIKNDVNRKEKEEAGSISKDAEDIAPVAAAAQRLRQQCKWRLQR